ncbi:hypothetical protein COCVIDRAFT_13955 [Bipolaris victoriae FI3]|uniref:Uncharacterized protein n=1 Tax=Bipolaris victoriae (strain FI3) TaxID=930091 RepID=W7EUD2_BIPV3|nr:hypothetical protein COCVIDRAFT_13955 [Bipolaris victoriae FI3]
MAVENRACECRERMNGPDAGERDGLSAGGLCAVPKDKARRELGGLEGISHRGVAGSAVSRYQHVAGVAVAAAAVPEPQRGQSGGEGRRGLWGDMLHRGQDMHASKEREGG